MTEALTQMAPTGFIENAASMVPLGRLGDADEIAGAAMFLTTDLSSYITGQTLHVDGGTQAAAGWYHADGHYVLGPMSSSTTPDSRTP